MRFEVVLHYALPLSRRQAEEILGVDPVAEPEDIATSSELLVWHLFLDQIPAFWAVRRKDDGQPDLFLMGPHLTIAEDRQWTQPLVFLESDILNMTEFRRKQSWKQWLNEELGRLLQELEPREIDARAVLIAQERVFRAADTGHWGWYTTIERMET